MSETLPLGVLQRWMQEVLVHPVSAAEGVESEAARRLVDPSRVSHVVVSDERLSAVERLGIYQEMYLLRMSEALESDYPLLARYLGPHRFWHFVSDYVALHPSRSYTLNRLGDEVPAFAATWGTRRERSHLADLARLELALTRVFDAGEAPPLGVQSLGGLSPQDLDALVFRPVSAFALERVRSAALSLLESLLGETPSVKPGREVYVLFLRRDYKVSRRTLPIGAGELLSRLVSGVPLGLALAPEAHRRRGVSASAVERWFREWVADGVFSSASVLGGPVLR